MVGEFPFFMCDTRTQRSGRERIVGRRQFRMLRAWLNLAQKRFKDRPKFVVSPSVVVPFLQATGASPAMSAAPAIAPTGGPAAYVYRSDGWDGFPDQLRVLFSFIVAKEIENVVWRACDTFRGAVDPSEYKNYILTMLFVKFLSDLSKDKRQQYEERYQGDQQRVQS